MLYYTIWWAGTLLEALVLARSFRSRALRIYSFFYAYVACVLITQVGLYVAHTKYPAEYAKWFWRAEIPTLILGCGIILEIFRHVLAPYPGAERFARIGGVFVFAAVFCFVILYPQLTYGGTVAGSMNDLERDLRTVQAIFLFGIVGVITYYGIPLGRNIRGMIFGYALYIATCLADLAVRSYAGGPVHAIWSEIEPFSYDLSLVIWMLALWSYQANPVLQTPSQLGSDYEMLATKTRQAMHGMRSYLTRVARP